MKKPTRFRIAVLLAVTGVAALPALRSHAMASPTDRRAAVAQTTVDPVTGELQVAPATLVPSTAVGPNYSASVAGTAVDPVTGELTSAPTNEVIERPGTNRAALVAATSVDAATGALISAPPTASFFVGSHDFSAQVAATSVNPVTGELLNASLSMPSDVFLHATPRFGDVAATSVNPNTGELLAAPPTFVFTVIPALPGIAATLLVCVLLAVTRRVARRRRESLRA